MFPALRSAWLCCALLGGPTMVAAQATTPATPATPAACDLHWHLSPQRDSAPHRLLVTLTLDAGNRSRTELQLPEGSDLALLAGAGTPTLDPVPGRPMLRSVAHRPGERLRLQFVLTPGPTAWLRLAPNSLIFAAPAVLPLPTEGSTQQMCLGFDALAEGETLVSNQGHAAGGEPLLRLQGPVSLARAWVVAVGALQQAERRVEGQPLRVVMAAAPPMAVNANTVADAADRQLGSVRRFWGDGEAPEQLLLVLPAPPDAPARGLAAHRAMLLQVPPALPLPGPELDAQLMQTAQQAWFRERFGPVAYEQRPDEAMNAWFSTGFATFYSQRLRSATAQQSLQAHAEALSLLLQAGTAATPAAAPWLAMRWHSALRTQGHAGLDAVLKRLMVPAAQARSVGPLSSPLATHRLQAALRKLLADAPRRDLQQLVEAGGPAVLTPETLGPCFRYDAAAQRVQPATEGEASPACQGWLAGTAPAVVAAAAPRQAAAGTGTKTKAKAKAKSGSKPKKAVKRPRH